MICSALPLVGTMGSLQTPLDQHKYLYVSELRGSAHELTLS